MNSFDENFKELFRHILTEGSLQENRTGIRAITVPCLFLQHDMRDGFPLSTLRKMPFKAAKVELEGFIKGVTDKRWYEDRGCNYWSAFASPKKTPYGHSEDARRKMREERDLGLIYGSQARDFHDPTVEGGLHIDQLSRAINLIKNDPNDRRMVILNWNPLALEYQALPACHCIFMLNVIGGRLNLSYMQRSADMFLGANVHSYALYLHLLAKECGLEEGVLSAVWHSAHIYENHIGAVQEVLRRPSLPLPTIETNDFTSIFDWGHTQTKLVNYQAGERIKVEVAV